MTYISLDFFYFLLIFLTAYSVVRKQHFKQLILLVGNIYFYCYAGISALFIILCSAVIVFIGTRWMDSIYSGYRAESAELAPPEKIKLFSAYKKKTVYIVWGILLLLLAVFVYVKCGKFLGWKAVEFAEFSFGKSIIVPLGLSYYTLSLIGYLLDVYRDRISCERNILSFVTCVTYFPHIIQGPISKYDRLLVQLKNLPAFEYERFCYGLQLMLWGYLKKLVLADTISLYTTQIFLGLHADSFLFVSAAVVLYAIQLYADFSGCIDIVTGLSEAMGIRLDKNFERPFFSRSAGEFWRRWHISLGVWFKEYIYMPIATASWFKNAVKKIRKARGRQFGVVVSVAVPSFAVWVLTGIWHGTGLDYVLWGLYWGVLIVTAEILQDKFANWKSFLKIKEEAFLYKIFMTVRTFGLYCIGLLFIIPGTFAGVTGEVFRTTRDNVVIVIGVALLAAIEILLEVFHKKGLSLRQYIGKQNILIRWLVYFGALFVLVLFGKFGIGYNAETFIYAGF